MGNRSKFSFPLPGRHRHNRETKSRGPAESPTVSSSSGLSKAQRILGTEGDLNIDSPTWDDLSTRSSDGQSWRVPTRRSSGMSISISESTQSTTYESEIGHNSDKWEQESGVFPRVRGNKASSTLLGQHYNDGATDSSGGRLRHEDSSSTLKSYYDRQKSPLAISQQTSESSARDLALRKGCPPVSSFQRSPLLQVDNADPFEHQFADGNALSQDKSRKKPAKLDLSMLFAKSRRNGKDDIASPSSVLTTESGNHSRRKLTKAPSKESLRSHRQSIRSNHTGPFNQSNTNTEEMKGHRRSNSDQKRRETKGTLYQLYDHYEQLPTRSPRMSQIPETRVADPEIPPRMYRQHPDPMPTPPKSSTSRSTQDSQSTPARESFSWKNVRASMTSPQQWEGQASSAASISSRNSKTSRHTSASQFSHNDLRQHSVLSLSSDSDSEQELIETARQELSLPQKNSLGHNTKKAPDHQRIQQSSNPIETMAFPQPPRPESRTKIHNSRKPAQTPSPFLAIPEVEPPNPRASQPRQSKDTTPRSAVSKDKKPPKRTASVTSATSQQPTPPLSPNSMAGDLQSQPQRSSRFMAVTKQEEALLEALRQKRANMRDKIINEHERMKTPPEMSKSDRSRNRFSEASSTGTVRASSTSNKKEEILLYLDTPIANMKSIYSAEPSPDLSDFLTFGASDEDSTPRKSLVQSTRGRPRPDSSVSPILDRGASSFSSMIPPTVRLSAVGSNAGFRESRTKKRSASSGVRFADDNIQQECPIEDNDTSNGSGAVWGLSGHI